MEWIKLERDNLPPQGLKILCFRKGDLWVCRRMHYKEKDYWIEIPYPGNKGATATFSPEYWMRLDLPEGYSGFMKVGIEGSDPWTFDELEKINPELLESFVGLVINSLQMDESCYGVFYPSHWLPLPEPPQ